MMSANVDREDLRTWSITKLISEHGKIQNIDSELLSEYFVGSYTRKVYPYSQPSIGKSIFINDGIANRYTEYTWDCYFKDKTILFALVQNNIFLVAKQFEIVFVSSGSDAEELLDTVKKTLSFGAFDGGGLSFIQDFVEEKVRIARGEFDSGDILTYNDFEKSLNCVAKNVSRIQVHLKEPVDDVTAFEFLVVDEIDDDLINKAKFVVQYTTE